MTASVFIPCFVDQLFPQTAFNMIAVLEQCGVEVKYNTNQTCCGQPAFNAGFWQDAAKVADKFIADFDDAEYVVMPSASCTGFVRNYYPRLLENGLSNTAVKGLQKKTYEFTEFLTDVLERDRFDAALYAKATYHDSCAALRECGIRQGPRSLLANVAGLELVEMADNETCCGFGGTFSVKYEPISVAMAEQKVENAQNSGADVIISTDLSCLMQIQGVLDAKKIPIRAMHIADVLASRA